MKKIIISIILSLLIIINTGCKPLTVNNSSNNTTKNENNNNNTNDNNSSNINNDNKILTEADIMTTKIVSLFDTGKAFDAGSYVSGKIPKGEYAFVKFNGSSSYYEEEDRAGDIIDNENFKSFGYVKVHGIGNIETRGVLISINSFSELGVTSAKEIFEKLNNISNYKESGYYKVGVDIQPGRYTIESIGKGYYAILSGPVGDSDIISNDNFNGQKQINLKNGQYLELSNVQIIN